MIHSVLEGNYRIKGYSALTFLRKKQETKKVFDHITCTNLLY